MNQTKGTNQESYADWLKNKIIDHAFLYMCTTTDLFTVRLFDSIRI